MSKTRGKRQVIDRLRALEASGMLNQKHPATLNNAILQRGPQADRIPRSEPDIAVPNVPLRPEIYMQAESESVWPGTGLQWRDKASFVALTSSTPPFHYQNNPNPTRNQAASQILPVKLWPFSQVIQSRSSTASVYGLKTKERLLP